MLKYILFLFITANFFAQFNLERLKKSHMITTDPRDTTILVVKHSNNSVRYIVTDNYSKKKDFYYPDSTIIDFNIDTTLYHSKYSYWNYVPLMDSPGPLVAGDINKNGKGLIFGNKFNSNLKYPSITCVYELNNMGKFDSVYSYDSTIFARSIYDINNDGIDEVLFVGHYAFMIDTNKSMEITRNFIFSKAKDSQIPQTLSFIFDPYLDYPSQQNNNTWGKFDNDQYASEVFINIVLAHVRIYKYNPIRNNLDSVYEYNYSNQDLYFEGFATGDFDNDGKTEFVMGSIHGKVIMFKNIGIGTYEMSWVGSVETNNAYLTFSTNDLDGNGKKEFWVGGDSYFDGIPITRLTCFESDGYTSYKTVGKIDIVGAFSLDAFNAFSMDVDNDGKEELVLDLGNTVMILKFAGSPNHQKYELFYAKQNEIPNSVFQGVSMADLNGDGKKELLISFFQYLQKPGDIYYSYIFKPDFLNGINADDHVELDGFQLFQNYPNPFNPNTNIKFRITERARVKIKIYNSIGKEIEILKDNDFSPGEYNINWDARDKEDRPLPSGIYLVRFISDKFNKTIKSLLLK